MTAYYNEIDPYAAQWLRNLIAKQLITAGEVDERPIQDVRPVDLKPFTRCHFFAGIAGWDIALRQASWPTDKQVWTGSNPCQPLSAAGLGRGFADERHLWPFWFHLIEQCRPPTIFGEQVSSKLALEWFELVQADLEGADYAVGSTDLCAASVGAPHIRQRLWFVADNTRNGRIERQSDARGCSEGIGAQGKFGRIGKRGNSRELAHTNGWDSGTEGIQRGGEQRQFEEDGSVGDLGNASGEQQRRPWLTEASERRPGAPGGSSPWSDCDWLPCTDGKARPVEPGTFPLAHGVQRRASKLRAYGNAIVPAVAAEFIKAYLACRP